MVSKNTIQEYVVKKRDKENCRESGVELLKIVAMVLIVLSHVIESISCENQYFMSDYVIPINYATTKFQNLVLAWFSTAGSQGNVIFLVCSAWFLLDSRKVNIQKVVRMLLEVWFINVIILVCFLVGGVKIPYKEIIQCIFPTIFELNWYISCYILLYLMHLAINQIIRSRTQKQLLAINLIMFLMYCGVNYLHAGHFFDSSLIVFVVIYMIVAYVKMYMPNYCANKSCNRVTLIVGIVGTPILILITNYLGFHFSYFQNKLTYWGRNYSPFLLLTAISLFNLFRSIKFTNMFINCISSLTLLIYIIHENFLIRTYIKPYVWMKIYQNFGYAYVVMWTLLQTIVIFFITTIIAFIYKKTIQKILFRISDKLYNRVNGIFDKILCSLMKLD